MHLEPRELWNSIPQNETSIGVPYFMEEFRKYFVEFEFRKIKRGCFRVPDGFNDARLDGTLRKFCLPSSHLSPPEFELYLLAWRTLDFLTAQRIRGSMWIVSTCNQELPTVCRVLRWCCSAVSFFVEIAHILFAIQIRRFSFGRDILDQRHSAASFAATVDAVKICLFRRVLGILFVSLNAFN